MIAPTSKGTVKILTDEGSARHDDGLVTQNFITSVSLSNQPYPKGVLK